jgi:hypothetical protein
MVYGKFWQELDPIGLNMQEQLYNMRYDKIRMASPDIYVSELLGVHLILLKEYSTSHV